MADVLNHPPFLYTSRAAAVSASRNPAVETSNGVLLAKYVHINVPQSFRGGSGDLSGKCPCVHVQARHGSATVYINIADVKETVAEKSPHDVERLPVEGEEDDIVEFEEKKDLKRGLKQRHIQMIALAGTIGTGLFLGSGKAIAEGGPAGALMGYTFVGCLVSCVCISIAEMAALVPLSGAIVRHAEYFFDPALSFAQGWNTIYGSMVGLPAEITATAVLMEFWVSVNSAVWITVFGLCLFASNLCLVKIYGELEFSFAMLKIILIIGLILMGIIVSAGGGPDGTVYGFKYWHDPGPFVQYLSIKGSLGRFCGFWTTFSNAAYAYSGVEGIPTAAAETRNPRRNIPKAAKRIFIRVAIFYIVSIFVVTLLVASNDPDLLKSTGTAAESPFVIAATNAGIPVIPHIVNAVVLTSAWSSGNSGMLGGSRSLYGIAREGHAPKVFLRVNRFGIPYVAVCFIGVFVSLGYLSCGSDSAAEVFGWLQDLVSAATFVNWIIICMVYLRFYYGLRAQGIDRKELPWAAPFQPYAAWIGLISFSILFLTAGFAVFIHDEWDTEVFFSAYFNMPLIFALYFGYKIVKRTKLVRYEDMPFQHFLQLARDNPEPPETPLKGWNKLQILWS